MLVRRDFDVDVLVVGGGGAGCLAAIKAREAGATVLMVTKGPFPSGNTSICRSYAVSLDPRDSPERHLRDVVRVGAGLNDHGIVRAFVNEVVKVTREMDAWGIDLDRKGGTLALAANPGHSVDRCVRYGASTGRSVMRCLGRRARDLGVRILEHTVIAGLLPGSGPVQGAWGIAYRAGDLVCITAKCVVLATGGMGQLFTMSRNVRSITGEGYALAFRAGAELINMEMIDFRLAPCYPERLKGYNWAGGGNRFRSSDRLYNGLGERFVRRYFPGKHESELSIAQRNRAVGLEIQAGRTGVHGGVYLDASDTPPDDSPRFAVDHGLFGRSGVDLRFQPMELVPGPRTFLGGARIDETGATTVEGLFAAGEVAGGALGANRLGGDALAAALGIGSLAGTSAARCASRSGRPSPGASERDLARENRTLASMLGRGRGPAPLDIRRRVRQIATAYLNVVRDDAGLRTALTELEQIRERDLPRMRVSGGDTRMTALGLLAAVEVTGQVRLAEIIATAALFRTESRGGHYRSDHPDRDDEHWLKSVTIVRQGDEIRCSTLDPVTH